MGDESNTSVYQQTGRIPYQMVLIIEARSTLLGGQQAKDARFVISNDGRDELADWSPHPVILIDAC